MNLIFIYYYVSAAVAQCQCIMILPQSHGFDPSTEYCQDTMKLMV